MLHPSQGWQQDHNRTNRTAMSAGSFTCHQTHHATRAIQQHKAVLLSPATAMQPALPQPANTPAALPKLHHTPSGSGAYSLSLGEERLTSKCFLWSRMPPPPTCTHTRERPSRMPAFMAGCQHPLARGTTTQQPTANLVRRFKHQYLLYPSVAENTDRSSAACRDKTYKRQGSMTV